MSASPGLVLAATAVVSSPVLLRLQDGQISLDDALLRAAVWAWVIGGVVFLLFGAMNYYTHIGLYYNIAHGTMHKW